MLILPRLENNYCAAQTFYCIITTSSLINYMRVFRQLVGFLGWVSNCGRSAKFKVQVMMKFFQNAHINYAFPVYGHHAL